MSRPSRWLSGLASLVAAYLAFLLARYFFPPHLPRFRVETVFMWFVAVGLAAIWARREAARAVPPERLARDGPGALEPWHYAGLFGLVIVVVMALYGPAIRIGLLSDDFVLADLAARRRWIHDAQAGFIRPVVPMFWAALSFVPLRFDVTLHLANLVLHAVNAVLVVRLALQLRVRPGAAAAGGLLFASFPGVSEAVVWASGVQDVLMTTLALVAICATLALGRQHRDGGFGSRAGSRAALLVAAVGAGTLALGVKETAVAIPVLAWLMACASPDGCRSRTERLALMAMTAITGLYAASRIVAGLPSGYLRFSRYLAKQLVVESFATLGAPWATPWIQVHPAAALGQSVVLILLLLAAVWSWRRTDAAFRLALASGAWVLIGVLPVFSLLYVSPQLEGGRYLYLSSVGFALLLATMLGDLVGRLPGRPIAWMGAAVIVLAMTSGPAVRSRVEAWAAAARLRDQVLDAYLEVMPFARCATVLSEGPVDGIDGAQVLRNGFMQALAARGFDPPTGEHTFRCRVNWTGRISVRQEE